MRQSLCWLVLLGATLPCGVWAVDPQQDAALVAKEAMNLQITEVRQIDPRTPEGEARLLELALDEKGNPDVRVVALDTLAYAKISTPAVQQGVLSLVSKEVEHKTRTAAVGALFRVRVPAREAVPKLIAVLDDPRAPIDYSDRCPDPGACELAVSVLASYGPQAREGIPALLWSINPKNSFQLNRYLVDEALGRIAPDEFPHSTEGEAAIQQMIKLLSSSVPGERRFAAENLLALQYKYPFYGRDYLALSAAAVPALEQNLDHPDRDVRLAVAAALLTHRADEQAAAILDEAIDSGVDYDRRLIFKWLMKYELHFDGTRLLYDHLKAQNEPSRLEVAARLAGSEYEEEAFELVRAHFDKTGIASGLGAFRRELLEPLRPKLEELAPERSTEGAYARNILKNRFGVAIEIEKKPAAKGGD